jgi:hypothetical protein
MDGHNDKGNLRSALGGGDKFEIWESAWAAKLRHPTTDKSQPTPAVPGAYYDAGLMFWLTRKKLVGSYLVLTVTRRL